MASSPVGNDSCSLSRRWILDPALADMLVALDAEARRIFSAEGVRWPGLFVISGFRSKQLQAEINPLVPKSLHTRCPSLAADLRVGDVPASLTDPTVWAFYGALWNGLGGRWGGNFLPTPDYNHFERPGIVFRPV